MTLRRYSSTSDLVFFKREKRKKDGGGFLEWSSAIGRRGRSPSVARQLLASARFGWAAVPGSRSLIGRRGPVRRRRGVATSAQPLATRRVTCRSPAKLNRSAGHDATSQEVFGSSFFFLSLSLSLSKTAMSRAADGHLDFQPHGGSVTSSGEFYGQEYTSTALYTVSTSLTGQFSHWKQKLDESAIKLEERPVASSSFQRRCSVRYWVSTEYGWV